MQRESMCARSHVCERNGTLWHTVQVTVEQQEPSKKSRAGLIAGVTVGAVVLVAIIGTIVYFVFFSKAGAAGAALAGGAQPVAPDAQPSVARTDARALEAQKTL